MIGQNVLGNQIDDYATLNLVNRKASLANLEYESLLSEQKIDGVKAMFISLNRSQEIELTSKVRLKGDVHFEWIVQKFDDKNQVLRLINAIIDILDINFLAEKETISSWRRKIENLFVTDKLYVALTDYN